MRKVLSVAMLLFLLILVGCDSSDKNEVEEEKHAESGPCSLCDEEPNTDFLK